jgi:hypothetical protein
VVELHHEAHPLQKEYTVLSSALMFFRCANTIKQTLKEILE